MDASICVIIPAAGSSRRYQEGGGGGGGDPGAGVGGEGDLVSRSKLDEDLGGRPVLQRTVELFNKHPEVTSIVVAGPHDERAFDEFKARHGDKLAILGVTLCRGGKTHRYETVRSALEHVPENATHIAVHDAARPCASDALVERVFRACIEDGHPAVVPGVDVSDTLKRVGERVEASRADPLAAILGGDSGVGVDKGGEARVIEETVDRAGLVAVQTPQIFEKDLLERAYSQDDLTSTDDSQLVERLGERVVVVAGESGNIKITRKADLGLARAIMGVGKPKDRATHKRF